VCTGEFWTINDHAAKVHGLNRIGFEMGDGPPFPAGAIRTGGNSGYQAVNLAWLFGAARIVLLGFDMGATGGRLHWHKDHGQTAHVSINHGRRREHRLHNPVPRKFKDWCGAFNKLAAACPVPIVNCSRTSALTCFPRMDLDAGLACAS
jgi:hypothetical protein